MNQHGPRILANVDKMKAQHATDDEIRQYLMAEGFTKPAVSPAAPAPTPAAPAPEHHVGGLRGLTLSALAAVPFSDELGSAIRAIGPGIVPGGQTFGEAYNENHEASKQALASYRKDHPIVAGAATLAASVPMVAETAPLGFVKGAALLGGLDAAGAAEGGIRNRAIAAPIGAVVGAALGAAGQKIFELGGTRALTGVGALVGAGSGHGAKERGVHALEGAAAGQVAGRAGARFGGELAEAIANAVRRVSPVMTTAERAAGKVASAAETSGIDLNQILAAEHAPRTNLAVLDAPGGAVQRLARAVESLPSRGSMDVRETFSRNAAFDEPAAQKAARKAIGNRFKTVPPIVRETKAAIARETAPAYEKLIGQEVSSEPLRALVADEPIVADILKYAQDVSKRKVKAGFSGVEEIPDLHAADGTPRKTFPVLSLDYIKRAINGYTQKMANSSNPLTSDEADILRHRLSAVMDAAKKERPELRDALENYAQVVEGKVEALAKHKQAKDFVLGGPATARIQADQGHFEEGTLPSGFSLGGMLKNVLESKYATRLRGINEATADEVAPMLTADLSTPEGRALLKARLEAFGVRRDAQQKVYSGVSRAAAGGAGLVTGSQFQGTGHRRK